MESFIQYKYLKRLLPLLLIALDGLIIYFIYFPNVFIGFDLQRDIERTRALIGGTPLFVGPDFTLGDYVYGPFYYLLLSPLVVFTSSVFSIALAHCFSRCIGCVLSATLLEREQKVPFFYGYCFFSASTLLLTVTMKANNASLLFAVGSILLYVAFLPFKNALIKVFFLSLLLSLSFQLHTSVLVFTPLIISIYILRTHSQQYLKKIVYGLTGFVIPLIPYAIGRINSFMDYPLNGPIFFKAEVDIHKPSMWQQVLPKVLSLDFDAVFTKFPFLGLEILVLFFFLFFKVSRFVKWGRPLSSFYRKLGIINCALLLAMSPWIFFNHWYRYYILLMLLPLFLLLVDIYHSVLLKINYLPFRIGVFLIFCSSLNLQILLSEDITRYPTTSVRSLKRFCHYFNDEKVSFQDVQKNTYEILEPDTIGSIFMSQECFKYSRSQKNLHSKYLYIAKKNLRFSSLDSYIAGLPEEARTLYGSQKPSIAYEDSFSVLYRWSSAQELEVVEATNIVDRSLLDPGIGKKASLDKIRQLYGDIIYTQSLCKYFFYCDLYLAANFAKKSPKVYFLSPLLALKDAGPVISGEIENLVLHYSCDGVLSSARVFSRFGVVHDSAYGRSALSPLSITLPSSCQNIKVHSVDFEKLSLKIFDRIYENVKAL